VPLAAADVAALEAIVRDSAAATIVRGTANEQLDQAWHGLAVGETVTDVDAFEAAVLERCGLVVDGLDFHYRSSFFDHVFEGFYAGRHYSYLWSGVLEAIAVDWLDASGGLTRAAGTRLREDVLARGALADPAAVLAGLTGRAWSAEPLLRQRGLI
jgi:peptidyl-dipeptidase Dcp